MAHQSARRRAKYRIALKLDLEWDADLIAWLEGLPPGSRSTLIHAAWRAGLRQLDAPARWEPVDVEELRHVVAEELTKALHGQQVAPPPAESTDLEQDDIEERFGAKLDRMLGGLQSSHSTDE